MPLPGAPARPRSRPMQWWRALSEQDRVDLYTRGSLYLLSASEPFAVAGAFVRSDAAPVLQASAVALVLAHTAACLALCRAGIDAYLGRRAFPRLEAVAATALGVAMVGGVAVVSEPVGVPGSGVPVAVLAACAYTGAAAATVVPLRRVCYATLLVAAALAAAVVARGASPDTVRSLITLVAIALFVVATYRFSVWLLGVVRQLADAQQARAALAVAQERLRFSRDLHDVVGRHLSAIAMKSELAAQLVRRGDERAADEALEVRGLAHDLQREVRQVVRGYREIDLDAELDGSRALLRSGGIRCRTVGDAAGWPPAVQAALGWGVREAVTNVLRHSTARNCTITLLSTDSGAAQLLVENDGVPAAAGPSGCGSGLAGLAERVRPLGGSVDAGREAPDRFVLRVVVPLGAR